MKFESNVTDQNGCWIYLDKIVPKDEEPVAAAGAGAAKKPPPPAKGKASLPTEEIKPTFGKAWIDLTQLMHPGATTLSQRIFVQQIITPESGPETSIHTMNSNNPGSA